VKNVNQPPVEGANRERGPRLGEDRTTPVTPKSTGNIEMVSKLMSQ